MQSFAAQTFQPTEIVFIAAKRTPFGTFNGA